MPSRVVLVTGGSRGIGASIVRRFAGNGDTVYFTYHSSKEEAARLADSLRNGAKIEAVSCDVRRDDDVERTVERILENEPRLDVLVNNAGIIRDSLFLSLADEDWKEVLDTNLGSVYRFCKAVSRQMILQGGGRIVNISSVVGDLGGFGQANYAASKAAINALTKTLASEFASKKVTVNAVAPGMVNTEMSQAVRAAFGEKVLEKIPIGSFAEPEEIASAVAFLASDEARYVTGQILTVDGGLSLLTRR